MGYLAGRAWYSMAMTQAKYNFQDPTVRAKASAKAAVAARSKTYNSKNKRIEQAKVEVFKDILLKEGYADAIRPHMPRITKAMIESASLNDIVNVC